MVKFNRNANADILRRPILSNFIDTVLYFVNIHLINKVIMNNIKIKGVSSFQNRSRMSSNSG